MLNRKITNSKWLILLFLSIFFIITVSTITTELFREKGKKRDISLISFRSDLDKEESGEDLLYKQDLSRERIYTAYSSYLKLKPGGYGFTFIFSEPEGGLQCGTLEVVADKGRKVLFSSKIKVGNGDSKKELFIFTPDTIEAEPRIIYGEGNKKVKLLKVLVKREKGYINPAGILFNSLVISLLVFPVLMSLLFAFTGDHRWKSWVAFFLTISGIFLIIKYAWVSEDAFITIRHIDNFINGYGAVFNIGERVEGYTHTLWFYLVSFLRYLGISPKGAVILPGILFSSIFLYLLFFGLKRKKDDPPYLNFAGAVLIGMSSFIDFGTSGLESSLSYLLLIIFSMQILKNGWRNNPVLFGLIVSLLTLNRPDFGIFLVFSILIYIFYFIKKEINFSTILKFFVFPFILLFGYEIFRMGYYGSMFPNPFYAKSGSASYFSQGFLYLFDLLKGSGSLLIWIFSGSLFFFKKHMGKEEFNSRILILFAGIFYAFFVIRGGGDFMHGRFLLPALILITISSSGIFDRFFSEGKIKQISAVLLIILILIVSRSVIPVQKSGSERYVNGISDERYTFYQNRILPLKKLFTDDMIFMWKTIGKNYSGLSKRSRMKLKIAYHTVGFLGYYSGNRVHVFDRLGLTDPVVARQPIEKRGRPGHEKSAPFGYLMYRELTFGETPFPLWNKLAETRYGILWDISRKTLSRFSFFLSEDFKIRLNRGINDFLTSLDKTVIQREADFLFFLKKFWYPNTDKENRDLFDSIYDETLVNGYSRYYKWIEKNGGMIEEFDTITKGKLTSGKFFKNIIFAVKNFFRN
ncbi:MAG: hypothetical protein ABFR75_02785 [Acidobacteriota bacterium]